MQKNNIVLAEGPGFHWWNPLIAELLAFTGIEYRNEK